MLPSDLLNAIASDGGGKVVLVAGAGCSMEEPTSLKSGRYYSEDAHRRLVEDGILLPDACPDPGDLSVLADLVFEVTGNQHELTSRLPKSRWQTPTPNPGHEAAAALLIEGALHAIVTLNFDVAFQVALSSLGNDGISIVQGPDDHEEMTGRSLIFLHRSAMVDDETWVLRKASLDSAWEGKWEHFVAISMLAKPQVVFAGLGSPAAVLTESVKLLAGMEGCQFFLIDPYPASAFADALSGHLTETVSMGWCEFAAELSGKVRNEQVAKLRVQCGDLAEERSLQTLESELVLDALAQLGLVALGAVRSTWLQAGKRYWPDQAGMERRNLADLTLGIGCLLEKLEAAIEIDGQGGILHIRDARDRRASLLCAHGGGSRTWSLLKARLEKELATRPSTTRPRVVLVSGLAHETASMPDNLVRQISEDDLIRGAESLIPLMVDEVRSTAAGTVDDLWRKVAA
jgi:hypothetical protein